MAKKKFCEYCMNEGNGWCNKSIIKTFDILKINKVPILQGELFISYDNKLEFYVDDCNIDPVYKKKVKIKYCPMCGCDLNEVNTKEKKDG